MESLFESGCVEEVQQRLSRLRPDQPRQWGTMRPAQMLAHCSLGLERDGSGRNSSIARADGAHPGVRHQADGSSRGRTDVAEFAHSERTRNRAVTKISKPSMRWLRGLIDHFSYGWVGRLHVASACILWFPHS